MYPSKDYQSLQKAFGEEIAKLGGRYRNMVLFNADNKSVFETERFEQLYEDRHFSFGLQQQNMVSTAAGMTVRGKLPVICFYSAMVGRVMEHLRNAVCYPHLNIKIIGSHAGLSAGEKGATYQMLEDVALMRALPHMKVVSPADAVQTVQAVEAIMQEYGPTYLRLPHGEFPVIYEKNYTFKLGYGDILAFGDDIGIIATGSMVSRAVQAGRQLEQQGISTMVVNMATIKPIDKNLVLDVAKKTKMIITLEDHNVVGGLGSAVTEVISENLPSLVYRMGMHGFGESAKAEDAYQKYALDVEGICEQILKWWGELHS